MNPAEARQVIRKRAADSLNVVLIRHARQQMQARKVDLPQVVRCLQRGSITEGPYRDNKSGQWRCNVEAVISGDRIRVVVEIPDAPPMLEVITVIALEG